MKHHQLINELIPGENYCDAGIVQMKKQMIHKMVNELPIEELEKIFQFKVEKINTCQTIILNLFT